ncbi:MAG: NUDIX domain-containing protein [Candidatus Nanohaloarchaea archaeon]
MVQADIARAIVVHDGDLLILQNSDDDPQPYARGKWETPGGYVEDHDDHEEAAVTREVREETGLDVDVVDQLERIAVTVAGDTADCRYYLAQAATRDVTLSDEHQAYRWIAPGTVRDVDWYYYSLYVIPVVERWRSGL